MTGEPTRVSRRAVLSAAATGVAAASLGALSGSAPAPGAAKLIPVSMAMHIHGPFSEGIGSYEAHLHQARTHDVDVIWWTDHDFRIAAHDHRLVVNFDGPSEPDGELSWTWAPRKEGALASTAAEFVAAGSGRALRLTATGAAAAGGTFWYAGTAWNYTYSTCIADTTLELDVLSEQVGPAAAFVLQMELSYHPARAGRPAGSYVLRYRVGGVAERRFTASGLVGTVELPADPGGWQRLRLDLVDDVQRLWPDLVAEDNSLRNLRVGVAVGAAATATAVIDRLEFHRARRAGQAAENLRDDVIDRYQEEYADVRHYRAYEISLVRHLNWYGGDQTLPPFPSPPLRDNDPALTRSMVDFLHSHGGIVCWNHPMDVEKRESLARLMIEQDNLGADLVEIGREPLNDLLWVLDVAARNAIFFTAVGSSDNHDGVDWLTEEDERRITCVWAVSMDRSDLLDALRRGRAWFTDPARYRGSLDIRVDGDTAMGAVAVTKASKVKIELVATHLPAGSTLEIITGAADRAGTRKLAPSVVTKAVAAKSVRSGRYALTVRPGSAGSYVRTQVRAADKTVVAASNPFWLLRRKPPYGVPAHRKLKLPTVA